MTAGVVCSDKTLAAGVNSSKQIMVPSRGRLFQQLASVLHSEAFLIVEHANGKPSNHFI